MTLLAVVELGRGSMPVDVPVLHADDEGVLRGRAVFETLRVYGGTPFRQPEHLARLAASAARVDLPEPDPAAFAAAAADAIAASGERDLVLRFLWTAGREGAASPAGFALASSLPPGLEELHARGLRVAVIEWAPGALAGAKSTSYAANIGAQAEAQRRGADDALLVDPSGTVLEAPTANVWWREGERLLTPTLEQPILAGITRAVLVELAPSAGYEVEEGVFPARAARRGRRGLLQLVGARGDGGDGDRRSAGRFRRARPGLAGPPAGAAGRRGLPSGAMSDEKVRLGGMALPNGVLVHGPTAWACAIRREDGEIEVASARKRLFASRVTNPVLRGPARIAEAFALLPQVKRKLPAARLPMQSPRVLASMVGAAVAVKAIRDSRHIRPVAQELLSGLLSLAPAALALRSSELAAYHGAEHISIGTYEHGPGATKEHERCGGHLVGPLVLTSAAGNVLAGLAPERARNSARAAAQLGALAASTEIFGWMTRNPGHPVAQALSRPGHELQHRLSTAEPSAEQLEVAEAALAACLALELDDGVTAGS